MSRDTLKDGREPGFYIIDNELIEHYGATIGVYGVAVYNVLAHYANKNGTHIFPSYQTIADKLGISRIQVIRTIKLLVETGLIKKESRVDNAGDMTSNEYTLVRLKGGIPQILPSNSQIPPSKQQKPQVVSDSYQGGISQIPDLDPLNKTQLEQEVAATQPPLVEPEKPEKAKVEKSVEEKAQAELTKAIMAAYIEVHGKNGVHGGKEGSFAKKLAKEGRTPEMVKGCYQWLKQKPFWADKTVGLAKVFEEMAEYEKQMEKARPTARSGKSQKFVIYNQYSDKHEEVTF